MNDHTAQPLVFNAASLATSKHLLIFDFDGTLQESKSPISAEVASLLVAALKHWMVAVISGEELAVLQPMLLTPLQTAGASFDRLHILPCSGALYYTHQAGEWQQRYAHTFTPQETATIMQTLESQARALGLWTEQAAGGVIANRGAQITFSALGQAAPVEQKRLWDPDQTKRRALQAAVQPLLDGYLVSIAGTTSIDVTPRGIDKAYGVQQILKHTQLPASQALFFGDKLAAGGNDASVLQTGVDCVMVENWQQTAGYLQGLLTAFNNRSV